ncbi:MAG: hypothetical protein ACOC5G_04655 [Acidobacteriota bacterium]
MEQPVEERCDDDRVMEKLGPVGKHLAIYKSAEIRNQMVNKRLSKAQGLTNEMAKPKIYPQQMADAYVISWGSTLGIVEEAVKSLKDEKVKIGYIHFSEIFPFRKDVIPKDITQNAELIGVENNATGRDHLSERVKNL